MLVNYKYCILNILRDFIVKTSNIMFMLRKEDNFDYIEIIVLGFSSSRAGRQQLRESCRLRRTAEPRAKAPWFVNPPLLSTKSRHHKFGASCKVGGGSLPAFRLRKPVGSNFAKAAACGGQPNHALKRRGSVIHPFPPLKKDVKTTSFFSGGKGWIRTTEDMVGRFTVCSLWPLGNLPLLELVTGIEPATC